MTFIDTWYNNFSPKLQAIACHFGYIKQEAEDIVQSFFLDLLQKNIAIEEIKNHEAYVVTAFKRKLIDLHRAQKRKGSIEEIESFYIPSAQEIIEELERNQELVSRIAQAYKKLPARFRRVIYMKYYQGYSTEKIVTQTGLSPQTVYNNLSKGIQHLRQHLRNEPLVSKLASFLFSFLP
ncbi:MAG: sigma-70 family RNA polymerase sigma factor [Filimonas sp.]|nr:sigma-70 family RNA polymerase sigma factor [Filimonas sp.]